MPAISNLLSRLGYVKLARYGLVLTPEGRIMSLRPVVLDDGLGGRIVGWPDGDLAAMELQKWEPARPAKQEAVATRLAVAPPPRPRPPAPAIAAPVAPRMPQPALVVAPAPVVAPEPQVDEDEWEWEIALARARVAAEEVEQAAASLRMPRSRPNTVPPPITQPAVVATPAAPSLPVVTIPARPRTEPLATLDFDDRTEPSSEIVRVAKLTERPAIPAERPQAAPIGVRKPTTPPVPAPLPKPAAVIAIPPKSTRPGTTPPTIIPVPKLPSIKDRTLQIQPVVPANRPSRTRLAKGTGPVAQTQIGVTPAPALTTEDKTSPGIALPPVARTVALPSVKRFVR